MKKLLVLSLCLFITGMTFSQTEEEMKAWQDYMKPGEAHEWLAKMDGIWDATVKMWMDPSQPAQESKAIATNHMIYNGLYQESIHKGNMWGMPFEGKSITAFDNAKKKFVSNWIDNMGSGIMMMEGDLSEDKKTLTLTGMMTDPTSGKDLQVKEVLTYMDEDHHKFEMFMMMGDTETKTMEMVYTRKK